MGVAMRVVRRGALEEEMVVVEVRATGATAAEAEMVETRPVRVCRRGWRRLGLGAHWRPGRSACVSASCLRECLLCIDGVVAMCLLRESGVAVAVARRTRTGLGTV